MIRRLDFTLGRLRSFLASDRKVAFWAEETVGRNLKRTVVLLGEV